LKFLLFLSVVLGLGYPLFSFALWIKNRIQKKAYEKRFFGGIIGVSASVLLSTLTIRLLINFSGVALSEGEAMLPWWQEIIEGIIITLDIIGGDKDFREFIPAFKTLLDMLIGDVPVITSFLLVYVSFIELISPILGYAILFDVLANIFPRLRLWWVSIIPRRHRYYFSKLNEASLSLAKSICTDSRTDRARPVIVFTDVTEKNSELIAGAKLMGAICVPDDISHVKKAWGKKSYFLIDNSETNNLQALVSLSDPRNCKRIKKRSIYVFVESYMYAQVEMQICEKLKKEYGFAEDELPTIVPVQIYRNLVSNLLVELPLFEPIVEKYVKLKESGSVEKTDLSVTILGGGHIGCEMFLGVYWIGQMLDVNLRINVVSNESSEAFWNKINYINPEIKKTVRYKEDQKKEELLLCRDGEYSDYYAIVTYKQADVMGGVFRKENGDFEAFLDSDYFVVALGSDRDNTAVAEKLRQHVGEAHIKSENKKKTVISYVVYDSELCKTLNRKKKYFNVDGKEPDVYMYAFGSHGETYSGDNVFMSTHSLSAKLAGSAYSSKQRKADVTSDNRARSRENPAKNKIYADVDYNYWANLAKAMHIKYKAFSLGLIETSVFDEIPANTDAEDITAHIEKVTRGCYLYKTAAIRNSSAFAENEVGVNNCPEEYSPEEFEKAFSALDENRDRLAWLEHRRWNAYTRVMGFRSTSDYMNYTKVTGNHKHMSIKLHPCLVECDDKGPRVTVTGGSKVSVKGDEKTLDRLDSLTKSLVEDGIIDYGFKEYDYCDYEFGDYYSFEKARFELGWSEKKMERAAKKGMLEGSLKNEKGILLIPKKFIDERKKK